MTLAQYLKRTHTTAYRLWKTSGIHEATLYRLLNGTSTPTLETANRIYRATGGAVRHEDWTQKSRRRRAA